MNNFGRKQNEEKMLMLQYSARCNYNRAEVINFLLWILPIINTVVLNIPIIKSNLGIYVGVISASITIAVCAFKKYVNSFTMTAAGMRQLFDYDLYGFKKPSTFAGQSENDLLVKASEDKQKNYKNYQTQIKHTGQDKEHGVKDWYLVDPTWDENTAIHKCQQQNPIFDKRLLSITKRIIFILLFFAIIIGVVLSLANTVGRFIINCCSFAPILTKIFDTLSDIAKLNKILCIEDERLSNLNSSPISIQKKIDERRRFPFVIPNFLYKILCNKLHNTVDDALSK